MLKAYQDWHIIHVMYYITSKAICSWLNRLMLIEKVDETLWESDHLRGLSKDRERHDRHYDALVLTSVGR